MPSSWAVVVFAHVTLMDTLIAAKGGDGIYLRWFLDSHGRWYSSRRQREFDTSSTHFSCSGAASLRPDAELLLLLFLADNPPEGQTCSLRTRYTGLLVAASALLIVVEHFIAAERQACLGRACVL